MSAPRHTEPDNRGCPLPGGGGCGQRRSKNSQMTPGNNQHNPQYANYWAPLTRKRHIPPHPAQPQHTNNWAPRTRKRHQQEHRPQRPTEHSDPTQQLDGMSHRGAPNTHFIAQPRGGGGGDPSVRMRNPPPPPALRAQLITTGRRVRSIVMVAQKAYVMRRVCVLLLFISGRDGRGQAHGGGGGRARSLYVTPPPSFERWRCGGHGANGTKFFVPCSVEGGTMPLVLKTLKTFFPAKTRYRYYRIHTSIPPCPQTPP